MSPSTFCRPGKKIITGGVHVIATDVLYPEHRFEHGPIEIIPFTTNATCLHIYIKKKSQYFIRKLIMSLLINVTLEPFLYHCSILYTYF
jgi:hypothetical protein